MIKRFVAALLIMILGVNMGFCQRNNTNNTELTKEEIQNLIDTYKDDVFKIIKKEKTTLVYDEHITHFKIYKEDNPDTSFYGDIGRIEIPLCDGDYVVWNSKIFNVDGFGGTRIGSNKALYAGEYHHDKTLMGIIKIKKINKKTIAFYEYRLNGEKDSTLNLKHIMVHYQIKEPVTFIVKTDGKIRGIRYKDQIFSTDLSNIVDLKNIDLSSIKANNDTLNAFAHGADTAAGIAVGTLAMPFVLAVMAFHAYILVSSELERHQEKQKKGSKNDNKLRKCN